MTVPYLVSDSMQTLEMEEENGVIRSMTRCCIIQDIPSTSDYTVLLTAYAQVGLPLPGSFLNAPFSQPVPVGGPTYPAGMLVLAKRGFKLNGDKNSVKVILNYQHFADGDNQNLSPNALSPNGWTVPGGTVVYGENKASVQQTKSNFINSSLSVPQWQVGSYQTGAVVDYRGFFWVCLQGFPNLDAQGFYLSPPPGPAGALIGQTWGIVTEQQIIASYLLPNGTPLSGVTFLTTPQRRQVGVAHQFPATDDRVPGRTVFQTGEFTTMQPNDNLKLHGQVFIQNPRVIKTALLGTINLVPWMDGNAYEWMCTEVAWKPIYVTPGLKQSQWRISMEFQHNPDTWLPTVVFNDQTTGRPPPNLLPGVGYQTLHKAKELDFNAYFLRTFGSTIGPGA